MHQPPVSPGASKVELARPPAEVATTTSPSSEVMAGCKGA